MGILSDATKIQWKHFGHKYKLTLSKDELNSENIFEILMKKINAEVPNFDGLIACLDYNNRQLIIKNDADLRKALDRVKDKLKIYTTLPDRGSLSSVDMMMANSRVCRSYSVPPKGCLSTVSHPITQNNQQKNEDGQISPPPTTTENGGGVIPRKHTALSRTERSNSGFMRNRHSMRVGSSANPMSGYHTPPNFPLGYHQSYSSYNNAPGPGMGGGPLNMLLNHALTGGRYYPGYGPPRPFIF